MSRDAFAFVLLIVFVLFGTYARADELLIPLASHPTSYHGKQIDHLNEFNYGIGYERDNVFGVIFKDSLSNASAVVGYNYRKEIGLGNGWRLSGTLATGIMVRKNVRDYTPFPVVLPFVGIGKDSWTAELTYIPATKFTEQGAAFLMLRKSL